jgi:hypothetical protein
MAVLFRPKRPDQFGAMAALGHEEQFSPPTPSARCVIRQETFAGTHGNGRDAPISAFRGTTTEREI